MILLFIFSNFGKEINSPESVFLSEDSNSSHPSVDRLALPKSGAATSGNNNSGKAMKPKELVDGLTSFFLPTIGSRRTTMKTENAFLKLQKRWGSSWTANNLKKKYMRNAFKKQCRTLAVENARRARQTNGLIDGLSHYFEPKDKMLSKGHQSKITEPVERPSKL